MTLTTGSLIGIPQYSNTITTSNYNHWVGHPSTSWTLPHFSACPNPGSGFAKPNIVILFCVHRFEVRGCCSGVVIGGIVDHSCLNFLLVPFSTYKKTPHIEEKNPENILLIPWPWSFFSGNGKGFKSPNQSIQNFILYKGSLCYLYFRRIEQLE